MLKSQVDMENVENAIVLFEKAKKALERAVITVQNDMEVAAYLFDAQKFAEEAHAEIAKIRERNEK